MGTPVEINPLQLGAVSSYTISRSVRLRSSASAYLSRTTTGSGSNTTATLSIWVKRGAITSAANQVIFASERSAGSDGFTIWFDTSDRLNFQTNLPAGANSLFLTTTQVFRDPSAWYNFVFAIDTSQAVAGNRAAMYVNGVQVTVFTTATYPSLNDSIWLGTSGLNNYIGRVSSSAIWFFDGYFAEYNVINGQKLTPSSFGYTDSNGIWQPKAYTGTYGTNGFYLKFTDNSAATATTIGKDYSGNGNNWTPNNISVTAGVTYDSMIDSPTVGASASNYCTLNPLKAYGGVQDGNLDQYNAIGNWTTSTSSFFVSSGKWYWEETYTNLIVSSSYGMTGIVDNSFAQQTVGNYPGITSTSYGYFNSTGNKYNNGANSAYGATYANNDIIGVALDMDNGTLTFYKNGVSQGTAFTGLSGTFTPALSTYGSVGYINFGQRPFSYTPPTGFNALNTYNLPAATINNGATVMAASTYTGTGANLTVTNTVNVISMQPDLVWIKSRSNALDHKLTDSVRGVTKALISDTTGAETTDSTGLLAFNSNGFNVGTGSQYNANVSTTYVAWQWQAGQGTTSSNTNGSITSTVSVNQSAGFSVVTYTGTGSAATVGHGLGVAPKMVITKQRGSTSDWGVYHISLTSAAYYLLLDSTAAQASSSTYWNSTAPTSSVFSVGTATPTNVSSGTYVAYCWSEVAGYSKFGSYTGNGSADGPFVYCGFRPRYVLVKRTDSTSDWYIWDTSRDTYNVEAATLLADTSGAETSATSIDGLSNGFKCRSATVVNVSSGTYIYAAFAENPFNISRAR